MGAENRSDVHDLQRTRHKGGIMSSYSLNQGVLQKSAGCNGGGCHTTARYQSYLGGLVVNAVGNAELRAALLPVTGAQASLGAAPCTPVKV